jgi:molybdate transport system regulatory protein
MSYKSAWEAVDTMNALSLEPIVFRETGGKDGGGTTITEYGKQLLENYAILKEEHSRFLERLSELTDIQSGSFKTIGRLAMQISARNQIQAEVVSVETQDLKAKVVLRLKSGQELISAITNEAVESLHIEQNQTVIAIFKSSAVCLSGTKDAKSKENKLQGMVTKIDRDLESAKVMVDIGNHDTIIAVVPTKDLKDMELNEGSSVTAFIKANDIMIGK